MSAARGETPQLGLATTRELLEEIESRGKAEQVYETLGHEVAIGAADLLDRLPGSMLEYRTVEEQPPPEGYRPWFSDRRGAKSGVWVLYAMGLATIVLSVLCGVFRWDR